MRQTEPSRPLGRLIAPQARDPAGGAGERSVQRAHLADLAAGLAVLDREPEAEDAVARDELLDLARVGHDHADAQAVALLACLQRLQRLGKVAAGVEGENVDVGAGCGDGMQQRLVLETEARREGDAAGNGARDLGHALLERGDAGEAQIEGRRDLLGVGARAPRAGAQSATRAGRWRGAAPLGGFLGHLDPFGRDPENSGNAVPV